MRHPTDDIEAATRGESEVVVVTGADNGIGLCLVKSLIAAGFRVAAIDLSSNNLPSLAESSGNRLRPYLCDVADQRHVDQTIAHVIQEWGRVDILVNNAAVAIFGLFEERGLDEMRREFEVNYFGYVNTIRAVLPKMKEQGKGIIHNVSSGVGITGFPGICGYASTKAAIEALSRTLRLELRPYGIAVTIIHPPVTNTRSAAPLGVPPQAMADPAKVGRNLARKVRSARPVITPDLQTSLGLVFMRLFPTALGGFLATMAGRARKGERSGT